MDLKAVGGGDDYLLRNNQRGRGEFGGDGVRSKVAGRVAAGYNGGAGGVLGVGMEHGDGAVAGFYRRPFDGAAASDRSQTPPAERVA